MMRDIDFYYIVIGMIMALPYKKPMKSNEMIFPMIIGKSFINGCLDT